MDQIFQLTYISTAQEWVGPAECEDILKEARERNALSDVTGLLLFNGKRFLQVLEGQEEDVRGIYALIEKDPRHHGLVVVGDSFAAEREFGRWGMAFDEGRGDSEDLAAKVALMLDRAGPSTRALFQSNAHIYRRHLSAD